MKYSIFVVSSLLFAALVSGNSINIFGTGLDANGSPLSAGSADPHWALVSSPSSSTPSPAVVLSNEPWSYPNHNNGQYIGRVATSSEGDSVGTFKYQTSFDLTGLDPSTASLTGFLSVDDYVEIYLNGADTQQGCDIVPKPYCYNSGQPFTISSGFQSGINTLLFSTYNIGGPTGLQVQISGTATPLTPLTLCNDANEADWTPYGQGYYCWNGNAGFVQCWGESPLIQAVYQPCASGTTCQCASGVECSNHGTQSPCQ
jgi:hypothetical protein